MADPNVLPSSIPQQSIETTRGQCAVVDSDPTRANVSNVMVVELSSTSAFDLQSAVQFYFDTTAEPAFEQPKAAEQAKH